MLCQIRHSHTLPLTQELRQSLRSPITFASSASICGLLTNPDNFGLRLRSDLHMNPTGTGLPPSPARWMRLLTVLHESCMRTCQIRGVPILLLSPSKSFHSYCIVHYAYIRTNMAIQKPCHARTIQYHLTIREFFCQEKNFIFLLIPWIF